MSEKETFSFEKYEKELTTLIEKIRETLIPEKADEYIERVAEHFTKILNEAEEKKFAKHGPRYKDIWPNNDQLNQFLKEEYRK